MPIGDQCQQCFNQYCWDGTLNTTANAYNPVLKSDNATFATMGQGGEKPSAGFKDGVPVYLWSILVMVMGVLLI